MTVKMLIMLTAPFGTFRSSVSLVMKPMFLISEVKLLTAALGTSMAVTTAAIRYVCRIPEDHDGLTPLKIIVLDTSAISA